MRFQQSSVSSHVHFGTLWKQFTRFKNPPSWQHVEKIGKDKRLSEYDAATTQSDPMPLYKWGAVEWTVWPFNTNEVDHTVETDWAHKEIVGAALYREWVGENDEKIHFRGMLFPYRLGGVSDIERLNAMRRSGIADLLVRGDGTYMGWFVCERLQRSHTFLSSEGVGRQISFEAEFARVPVPDPDSYFSKIWQTTGAAGL